MSKTVLVVEDNSVDRTIMVNILRKGGFSVTIAEGIDQAEEFLRSPNATY